jgi:hypothetical protein
MVRDEWVTWDTPSNTRIVVDHKVALPQCIISSEEYDTIGASEVFSGLRQGNYDPYKDDIDYDRTITVPVARVYNSELEELKYLFNCFHFVSRVCRKKWLSIAYHREEKLISSVPTLRYRDPIGFSLRDHPVILSVEGTRLYLSVEEYFQWIERYRLPGVSYVTGDCDNQQSMLYSIYLEKVYGLSPDVIMQYAGPDVYDEVMINLSYERQSKKDFDTSELTAEDAELLTMFKVGPLPEETARALPEYSGGYFDDLETVLENMEDEDSEESHSDFSDDFASVASEDTIDRIQRESTTEVLEEVEEPLPESDSEASSIASDNISPCPLNEKESLSLDFDDETWDKSDPAFLRRMRLVWNPGGSSRTSPSLARRKTRETHPPERVG